MAGKDGVRFEGGSDPSKDRVEKTTERGDRQGLDDMIDSFLGTEPDPDREGLDVRARQERQEHDEFIDGDEDHRSRREPEVRDRDRRRDEPRDDFKLNDRRQREPEIIDNRDDRRREGDNRELTDLEKALARIDELQDRIERGDVGRRDRDYDDRRDDRRREPMVEMVEIIQGSGLTLPKDPNNWAIKGINNDVLVQLGWNDENRGPGHVLAALANMLFNHIATTIPEHTARTLEISNRVRNDSQKVIEDFERRNSHLVPEITQMIERRLRNDDRSELYDRNGRIVRGRQYEDVVVRETERYLADLRGISVEQLRAQGRTRSRERDDNRGNDTRNDRGRSRAASTAGGSRGDEGRGRDRGDNRSPNFERDASGMMDSHFRRR